MARTGLLMKRSSTPRGPSDLLLASGVASLWTKAGPEVADSVCGQSNALAWYLTVHNLRNSVAIASCPDYLDGWAMSQWRGRDVCTASDDGLEARRHPGR